MVKFRPAFKLQGFDKYTTPRYQMVPIAKPRYVMLRDAAAATVSCANPALCDVQEVAAAMLPADEAAAQAPQKGDRYFRLEGIQPGRTLLEATGLQETVQLDLSIKSRQPVRIAFLFVTDNKGRSSKRPQSDVGPWVKKMQYVWGRQANLEIVPYGLRSITINSDLGDTIYFQQGGGWGNLWNIFTANIQPGAHLNVFLVHRVEEIGRKSDLDGMASYGTGPAGVAGLCLFEDDAKDAALSMAHELGHHLGIDHPGHRSTDLMWYYGADRTMNLTAADIEIANP